MSNDMKPEIRFPGFTEDWEQRKVGEFYDFKNGLNKEKEFFGSGVPIVNFVDVFHNRGLTPEMLKGRVTLSEKEIKNFEVKQGDIFFTRTSETINEIGYPSVMLGAPTDTVFSGFVLRGRARSVDPMNNLFKRYVFFTESFRNEMVKKSSMTTRALTSGTAIKEMYVQYPTSKDEQHKIGAFLAQIDETITLKQRKLDLLKETKKGFLQKMFPKNGAKVPEIRFPGFTGDWEQRKFEEIWKRTSDKNKDLRFKPTDILSVAKMKYSDSPKNSTDEYMKTYFILKKGDIAFEGNKSKDYSFGRFVLNDVADGIVSHVFITFEPIAPMDINFMKIYINNEEVMKHKLVRSTTKTLMMTTLNVKDINRQMLPIPNLEEQQKIGTFFKQLDDTITLHQRKLDLLKETKKGFLQKMFV
ncbi:restriction endonuclease subunit S [Enterococcus hirae]|uniref:restriction endonuclease subunit S n=1 Tax=Enterococcus hirae TaxID=1354 RepID=UPI00201A0D89|nr:restriction endonuclease subunit S [Enterococcus hirae]EMF0122893.1 restriction endonuclease subunit S [Enterococcus hirae]EMF0212432.1 restriction endonuclease subunit S [Enterococcus hirae]EMF0424084.1 restriction endonuclease subunit S [Enterococcus hirae]MCL4597798.1 restriction endonuclease subunit S [Enterococcus hirae]UQR36617.1 restriction endonuclease subunit S [Enterococcus hirae]